MGLSRIFVGKNKQFVACDEVSKYHTGARVGPCMVTCKEFDGTSAREGGSTARWQ